MSGKAGNKVLCFAATALLTVVAVTCTFKLVIPVDNIVLDMSSASITVGESLTLKATVKPEDATYKTVDWISSDTTVAVVYDGYVAALKTGTATITALSNDNKSANCTITVTAPEVSVVTLDKTNLCLKIGEKETLTATVRPDDATDKTVTWSSSDASVATVSGGVVTAVKVGSATITAGSGTKTATCSVKVVATPVESVTLDKTSASLKAGESVTLTATVRPDDATDKTVTWSSSDASVATVSGGVVTAVKVGSATITAGSGTKTATCSITVESNGPDPGENEDIGFEDW